MGWCSTEASQGQRCRGIFPWKGVNERTMEAVHRKSYRTVRNCSKGHKGELLRRESNPVLEHSPMISVTSRLRYIGRREGQNRG